MQFSTFRALLLSLPLLPPLALADASQQLDFSARSRYAEVDNSVQGRDLSVLLRADLNSHWNELLSSKIEVDYVKSFLPDDHSDGVHLNNKPLIPDAPGADLNQALVSLKLPDMIINLGRQRLNFDDQRFVGGNGFWQNEQTFDALNSRLQWQSNSNISYTYVANVNRILGDDATRDSYPSGSYGGYASQRPAELLGDHRHHTQLLRAEWNEWDYSQLVGYGYFIRNKDLPSDSTNTLGASYSFNYKAELFKYRVQLEAATQARTQGNSSAQIPYYLVDAGLGINRLELSGRYEVLAAKNGTAFITPLGSLQDFLGWANNFSYVPSTGISDASLRLLWRAAPFRIDLRYHLFNQYHSSTIFGRETDLDLVYKPARKHSIALRYAYFQPEHWAGDSQPTRKLYLDYVYNM